MGRLSLHRGSFAPQSALLLLTVFAFGLAAHTQTVASAAHTRLELVSERTAAVPGQRLWLGLHFQLEPGWHIYWLNPGDSGEPPRVQWSLPAGWRAGALRWPLPERLRQGTIVNFGYENDVLLAAPLDVPASARPPAAEISADMHWLVCRDVCLPERARVSLRLPVSSRAARRSAAAPLFARARVRWPQPMPAGWRTRLIVRERTLTLEVHTGRPVPAAEFFPYPPDPLDHAAPVQVNPIPAGVRLILRKSDFAPGPVNELAGILVLPGSRPIEIRACAEGTAARTPLRQRR